MSAATASFFAATDRGRPATARAPARRRARRRRRAATARPPRRRPAYPRGQVAGDGRRRCGRRRRIEGKDAEVAVRLGTHADAELVARVNRIAGEQRLDRRRASRAPDEDVDGQIALDAQAFGRGPPQHDQDGHRDGARREQRGGQRWAPRGRSLWACVDGGEARADRRPQRCKPRIAADLRCVRQQGAVPARARKARHQVGAHRRLRRRIELAGQQLVQAQIGQVCAVIHDATSRVKPSADCARV